MAQLPVTRALLEKRPRRPVPVLAILLLALLTEWNVTNETLARWHELDALTSRVGIRVTPEIADRFGLNIIGLGGVVAVVGYVMARATRSR